MKNGFGVCMPNGGKMQTLFLAQDFKKIVSIVKIMYQSVSLYDRTNHHHHQVFVIDHYEHVDLIFPS